MLAPLAVTVLVAVAFTAWPPLKPLLSDLGRVFFLSVSFPAVILPPFPLQSGLPCCVDLTGSSCSAVTLGHPNGPMISSDSPLPTTLKSSFLIDF